MPPFLEPILTPITTLSFASFDGVSITFDQFGTNDGVPVILQHGFAADGHGNWVAPGIVSAIVANGRHVIVPDARGHGRSDKPHDPSSYGHGAMARDLTALADHLGLAAFDIGGYSMGGHIALHLLRTDPRVRSTMIGGIGRHPGCNIRVNTG